MKSTAPTEDNVLALRDLVEKETNLLDNRQVLWCFALGHIFADLVPKNIALAKHYFSLSGSLGHGEGYRKLGDIYMSEGEWHQAKEAFEKGAALQSVGAMHLLGTYYQDGSFGGSSDYRAAKKWFKEGARLGDKDCIHSLGSIYFFGQGTTVNHEKAVAYFRRSAAEGDADSQVALGTCYAGGNGVVQSLEQAQYWWGKAEAQGRKRGRQDIAEGICY
jgi:TPR repeat protein